MAVEATTGSTDRPERFLLLLLVLLEHGLDLLLLLLLPEVTRGEILHLAELLLTEPDGSRRQDRRVSLAWFFADTRLGALRRTQELGLEVVVVVAGDRRRRSHPRSGNGWNFPALTFRARQPPDSAAAAASSAAARARTPISISGFSSGHVLGGRAGS